MNKIRGGKTSFEYKTILHDIISILFCGVDEAAGKISFDDSDGIFNEEKLYNVIHKLSKEFPDDLYFYFAREIGNGFMYSKDLEDILFSMGAFRFTSTSGFRYENIVARKGMRKSMFQLLLRQRGEDELRKYIPMVKRFNQLMTEAKGGEKEDDHEIKCDGRPASFRGMRMKMVEEK